MEEMKNKIYYPRSQFKYRKETSSVFSAFISIFNERSKENKTASMVRGLKDKGIGWK